VKKFDIDIVYKILKKEVASYQVPIVDLIEVTTKDPFKVLVTTILSARTNDRTTAKAAEKLFLVVSSMEDMAALSEEEIIKLIFPVGFYRNKARFLKQLPAVLKEKFNSKVPDDLDLLTQLPGVGRKTANLVLAVAFKKPAVCVDTHVHRITNIWGYVKTKTPFETEMELRKKLPKKYWISFNSILVAYGQYTCRPISPHCDECVISDFCARKIIVKK